MTRSVNQVFDEMLVLYAIDGNRDAQERLARRWCPLHYKHACRLLGRRDLAADAVQDAWIGILRGLWRLQDPAAFPAWSYSIVTKRCHDVLRRRYRLLEVEESDVAGPSELSVALDSRDVHRALQSLNAEQRASIALHYGEGLTVTEIAVALSVPPGTVKTRLFHARRILRRYFGGHTDERI
jgi:RNA polymerase sigma factor (sigma-70 family)